MSASPAADSGHRAWGHVLPDVRPLFPGGYGDSRFAALCGEAFAAMAAVMPGRDLPRVPGWKGPAGYEKALARYRRLPDGPAADVAGLVQDIAADLFAGTTLWRCPELQYTIDDIAAFASLRNELVSEFGLGYRPHLHVDSVIGWGWLMLDEAMLSAPVPGTREATLVGLREQHRRISQLGLADSWGVDFHKGIGGCPVDCSMVMFTDKADLGLLRKGAADEHSLHQLAAEFSALSPVDYTLETARAGGKAIAALTALHSMGRVGYQAVLAGLVDAARVLRDELAKLPGITVLNEQSLGFTTMAILTPPGMPDGTARGILTASGTEATAVARRCNDYLKAFFAWDNGTRMNVNGGGAVYSYSSGYLPLPCGVTSSALKFYPTSPLTTGQHMREAAVLLAARKAEFDRASPA